MKKKQSYNTIRKVGKFSIFFSLEIFFPQFFYIIQHAFVMQGNGEKKRKNCNWYIGSPYIERSKGVNFSGHIICAHCDTYIFINWQSAMHHIFDFQSFFNYSIYVIKSDRICMIRKRKEREREVKRDREKKKQLCILCGLNCAKWNNRITATHNDIS